MQLEGTKFAELHQDIEVLRNILEHEQLRHVTYDEAGIIACSLLEFYEALTKKNEDNV